MTSLKVFLYNSAKQKIAKFSIENNDENAFIMDKYNVSAMKQVCTATLEMAQDNTLLDLSLLEEEIKTVVFDILNREIEESIHKKKIFTSNTKPKIQLEKEIKLDRSDLLGTNAELCPPAA